MLHRSFGENPVAEVEDVPGAIPGASENLIHPP
jgi:hypothetical protein